MIDPTTAPEARTFPLFDDRWIGVVRDGHPLASGKVSAQRYAAAEHVHVQRRGLHSNDIDDAVNAAGLERRVAILVHGFASALALARETELVATVPERHTAGLRKGMKAFTLPLELPTFTLSMLWHPRMDSDLPHRWLRGLLKSVCAHKGSLRGNSR